MSAIPSEVARSYGDLPNSWRLGKLKFSARVRNSNVDKKTEDGEEPVRLCNYTDVYYNDRITPDMDFMEATATESEIERFTLKQGQVIITKDSEGWDDIGIPAYVTEDMPGVLCGYHLSVLEPDGESLDGAFLSWLCRADPLNDQFKLGSNGVTRYGLGQYPLKSSFIPLPDIDTQRRIAGYLDDKTARIDALIEKKWALLDRLAEKRQALITRAVTRGLNPAAPLKDSGVDWLGQVPAHWEVWPLKRYLTESQYGISEALSEAGEVAILRMGNIQNLGVDLTELKFVDEVAPFLLLQDNDVLFNRTNSIDLVGKSAIYKGTYDGALSFASYLARFRFDGRYLPEFANFVFGTEQLLEYARTMAFRAIGQANLNPTRFAEIALPVPPVDEQKAIIEFLTPHGEQTEAVTSQITTSIEKLTEYRAALVTAAVTGKIRALLTDPAPAALIEEA